MYMQNLNLFDRLSHTIVCPDMFENSSETCVCVHKIICLRMSRVHTLVFRYMKCTRKLVCLNMKRAHVPICAFMTGDYTAISMHMCEMTYVKWLVHMWDVTQTKCIFEQIELQAKLQNYFLGSNKSNINQNLSVYMYAFTFIYAHVWVYICTRVGAFCLFVLSNLSATCACITGVS